MQYSSGANSPNLNATGNIFLGIEKMPIIIDPVDLSILINTFYDNINDIGMIMSVAFDDELKRIKILEKNILNGISKNYYRRAVKEYMPYFKNIDSYLNHSSNTKENERYHYIAREINRKLVAYRERFYSFDEQLEYLVSEFIQTMQETYEMNFEKKELINIFFGYMYYCCDIGENNED